MLEVGNDSLSEDEERTHFGLWALMKAPLLIGCDAGNIPGSSLKILTNPEARARGQPGPERRLSAAFIRR